MPLKDLEIRALKPQARPYKRTDERGLYLEVRPNGSKLWRFSYSLLGKQKRIAFCLREFVCAERTLAVGYLPVAAKCHQRGIVRVTKPFDRGRVRGSLRP